MNEQEKVQADQTQEPEQQQPKLDEEERVILYGHRIIDCHGKQDGSLGKLLEELSTEAIHENDYKAFRRIYDGLTNNSKCACGSGITFHGCCKRNWNLLDRAHKNRVKMSAQEKKGEAGRKANVKYAIVLEVMQDGGMNTRMLDETTPRPSMDQMEYLFHTAHENFKMATIMQMVQRTVNVIVDEKLKQFAPQPEKTGGGIITP